MHWTTQGSLRCPLWSPRRGVPIVCRPCLKRPAQLHLSEPAWSQLDCRPAWWGTSRNSSPFLLPVSNGSIAQSSNRQLNPPRDSNPSSCDGPTRLPPRKSAEYEPHLPSDVGTWSVRTDWRPTRLWAVCAAWTSSEHVLHAEAPWPCSCTSWSFPSSRMHEHRSRASHWVNPDRCLEMPIASSGICCQHLHMLSGKQQQKKAFQQLQFAESPGLPLVFSVASSAPSLMPNCSAPKLYWPGQSTAFGGCLLFELSVLSIYRLHRKHVLITYVSKHKLGSTGAIAHGPGHYIHGITWLYILTIYLTFFTLYTLHQPTLLYTHI